MNFTFRDNIEQMDGYVPGYQPVDGTVIKLNTNENPYPPSPRVLAAIGRIQAEQLRRYPPVRWDAFREAAHDILGLDPAHIVCGNGGDELLTMLVRCCCDRQRALAYPTPTYTLYRELARIQDCPIVEVPYERNDLIPAGLAEAHAALTILCNPNAPTGALLPIDAVADLAVRVSGVLLVDEAYVDFAEENCLELVGEFNNVAVLRSLSKGYSLAGLRFGYVVASSRIVEAMIKVKDSYNVNVISQEAPAAALRDQDYHRRQVEKVIAERERLTAALRELGLSVPASQTNFVLAAVPAAHDARTVYERLCTKYIYVRYFDHEGLRDKLRITVGNADQNDALIGVLRDVLAGH